MVRAMKKIICLGDSNTYGFDPRNYIATRYDCPWTDILTEQYEIEAVNLGENGLTIPNNPFEEEFFDGKLRQKLPADAVTVMLGTNDLLNSYVPHETVISFCMETYLRHLLQTFPNVKLILIAPPPVNILIPSKDSASRRLADYYRALAERLGIGFADASQWNLELAYDGVHLTEDAHRSFALHLKEALEELI